MSLKISSPKKVSKKESPYKYAWVQEINGHFTLRADAFKARVYESEGKWRFAILHGLKVYRGTRESLEAVEKSVDRWIYKNYPRVWTTLDARVIIAPWRGDLQCQ